MNESHAIATVLTEAETELLVYGMFVLASSMDEYSWSDVIDLARKLGILEGFRDFVIEVNRRKRAQRAQEEKG